MVQQNQRSPPTFRPSVKSFLDSFAVAYEKGGDEGKKRWRRALEQLAGVPTEVPAVVSTFSIYYVRGKSTSAFEDRSRSVQKRLVFLHLLRRTITLFLSLQSIELNIES